MDMSKDSPRTHLPSLPSFTFYATKKTPLLIQLQTEGKGDFSLAYGRINSLPTLRKSVARSFAFLIASIFLTDP